MDSTDSPTTTSPSTAIPTQSPITAAPTQSPSTSPTANTDSPTPNTASPTKSTAAPTLQTPSPTLLTESPTVNTTADSASPTSAIQTPTNDTPSPTDGTPAPTLASITNTPTLDPIQDPSTTFYEPTPSPEQLIPQNSTSDDYLTTLLSEPSHEPTDNQYSSASPVSVQPTLNPVEEQLRQGHATTSNSISSTTQPLSAEGEDQLFMIVIITAIGILMLLTIIICVYKKSKWKGKATDYPSTFEFDTGTKHNVSMGTAQDTSSHNTSLGQNMNKIRLASINSISSVTSESNLRSAKSTIDMGSFDTPGNLFDKEERDLDVDNLERIDIESETPNGHGHEVPNEGNLTKADHLQFQESPTDGFVLADINETLRDKSENAHGEGQ